MNSFFSRLFGNKIITPVVPVLVDMHSHLLPGIDDGVQSLEEAYFILKEFEDLGYKKIITTPHIMADYFRNTPEIIHAGLKNVQSYIKEKGLTILVEAAAEYYLDENFIDSLVNKKQLLTFGENYLLFETSYLNEPVNLLDTIFNIKAAGYWPVLAHPERYNYYHHDFSKYEEIYNYGVSFQLNINSLTGYYSKSSEAIAHKLIEKGMISFIGSDCHSKKHMDALKKTRNSSVYEKLLKLALLNNSLL